jgi:hypothetical protein
MKINVLISFVVGIIVFGVIAAVIGNALWVSCSATMSCPGILKCMGAQDGVCITYAGDNQVCQNLNGHVSGSGTEEEMQQVAKMSGMKLPMNHSYHGYMMLTDCFRTYFISEDT